MHEVIGEGLQFARAYLGQSLLERLQTQSNSAAFYEYDELRTSVLRMVIPVGTPDKLLPSGRIRSKLSA